MGLKIMIVDDSAVMRKMINRTLDQSGLDISAVVEAGNGKEALDKANEEKDSLDLIFTDWNMPEMDGVTFVREARKIFLLKDTPIIMVTTEANLEKVKEAKEAGASGYITKPFTPEKMKEKVSQILKR